MGIPAINRIINLETIIHPSLFSQVSGICEFHQTYNLLKWGALILALIASLTTIINRVKLLIIRLHKHPSLSSSQHHLFDDDDSMSDTDSFSSHEDDEEEREDVEDKEKEEEESATTSFSTSQNWRQVDEDFRVRGSGYVYVDGEQWQNRNLGLRRRRRRSIGDLFPWSELMTSGKSVVNLWDNLGLGLSFITEDDSENEYLI